MFVAKYRYRVWQIQVTPQLVPVKPANELASKCQKQLNVSFDN